MSKNRNKSRKKKSYLPTKWDYIKAWFFSRHVIKRMGSVVNEALAITPESYKNVPILIEKHANDYPNDAAILFEDKMYTHKEYNEWCNRYAHYFQDKVGLKKGDIAVVFMTNRPEIMFAIYGLSKIGVVSSLINTKQRSNPLIHSINIDPGKVFIIGEELIEAFEEVRHELKLSEEQSKHLYFVPDTGEFKKPDGFHDLSEIVKNEDINNPSTSKTLQAIDPYAYIFTSGTTGLPKAAVITHGHTYGSSIYWGDTVVGLEHEDIIYVTTPLFHSHAINVAYASSLRYGSTIAIRRKFSASQFWDDAIKFKATCFNYIGEICRYLHNQPEKSTDRKHLIKKIVGNGLRNEMWRDFKKRFGIKQIFEFYGATERFAPNFANRFNLNCTVGFTLNPYAIVKYDLDANEPIRDENGHMIRVKEGEAGLLIGQIIADDIFIYTSKTADEKKIFKNVFEDGDYYFNSGDIIKEIGHFKKIYKFAQFADRIGDTFRWKGENVSTEEVEAVVNDFKQVEMSCVYGVLIPNTEGRAGMACLVTNSHSNKNFDFSGFYSMLQESLPEYAIPKFIRFTPELITTATLKIQKGNLKKESFNPEEIEDPLYILLPNSSGYELLTKEIYNGILNSNYNF
ncbi:MAG: long-chain-acyl-CoA synthetase [Candidatus Lokiarchaeota archaeon]|nr:long-chain-acyl-CoA synthetase [Candidatus Lokiarchaeota archaeon]